MATRMSLRKREAPTTALVQHRDALISRLTKRARLYDDDETETDARDDDDTESDDEDWARRKARVPRVRAVLPASPTDKALTFLQSAQMHNTPVRSGKWNEDEEAYLRKLVQLFNLGLLDDVETRTSMRMWLAKMLHCCPMRISKKQMHGEKFKGKAKYARNLERILRLTQKDFTALWEEVHRLRANFLKLWAKEEFGRWGRADQSRDFGKWYDAVVRNVPKPRIAKLDHLKVPDGSKIMEPWAAVRQDIELMPIKPREPLPERDVKRRFGPRASSKKHVRRESDASSQESVVAACQNACCVVPSLDLSPAPQDAVFEPIPPQELEIDVDLAALVSQWDDSAANASTPTKNVPEQLDDAHLGVDQHSPSIVLDFGPPSLWEVDPILKDSTTVNQCEWVDDLLGEVGLLGPSDLPTEPWFQQLCTTFQL